MNKSIEEILRGVRIDEIVRPRGCVVTPETPLGEVYRLLDEERPGAVVVRAGERVVGIFTERDVLYRTALEGRDPATPIGTLMSGEPATLPTGARLAEAIELMTESGYRHLPLTDAEGRWAGFISTREILGFIAEHFPEAVLNLPPRLHQQLHQPDGG